MVFIPIAMNNHIGIMYSNMVEFARALPYRAEDACSVGKCTNSGRQMANPEKPTNHDYERSSFPVSRLHGSL